MNESDLKVALRKKLIAEECNALIYSFAGSAYQTTGIPDWYLAHRIWSGWLELKNEDNPYSPHQKTELRRLQSRGVKAYGLRKKQSSLVLESVDSMDKVLEVAVLKNYNRLSGLEFLEWLSRY